MESGFISTTPTSQSKWVRSDKGLIAGICQGLGERMGIDPILFRVMWVLSVCIFGLGLAFYLILWITLPTESKLLKAQEGKILGVCQRLGQRANVEIPLLRAIAVFTFISSCGSVLVVYGILHFILPKTAPSA